MPPCRQVIDSLWHCLCPSFGLAERAPGSRLLISTTKRPSKRCLPAATRLRQGLSHSSHAPESQSPAELPSMTYIRQWKPLEKMPRAKSLYSPEFNERSALRFHRKLERRGRRPVEELYDVLDQEAASNEPLAVENMVQYMIQARGERPNARMYAALLKTCAHLEYGSAVEVERLLKEMEHNEIYLDSQLYESALLALAMHPSYVLREALLENMKRKWVELSPNAWHSVCCAQLREKQVELALETLEKMEVEHEIHAQPWLLDIFCHILAELGEFEELSRLLNKRAEQDAEVSNILWLQVLTRAAERFDHPMVSSAWKVVVRSNDINPSTGLCTMVLDTAARAGDEPLAVDVLRVMGNRSSPIQPHHFEALVEASLRAEEVDLLKVLTFFCVMENTTPESVTWSTTRSFLYYLKRDPVLSQHVEPLFYDARKSQPLVPIAVLDAFIEAAIHHSDFDQALRIYRDLHQFSRSGTDNPARQSTFTHLLKGCLQGKHKTTAAFLAAEMVAMKIQPNADIYNALVLTCLAGNQEDSDHDRNTQQLHVNHAFQYLEEMRSQGYQPSEVVFSQMAKALARLMDGRLHGILDDMERMEMNTTEVDQYVDKLQRKPWPWMARDLNSMQSPEL